MRVLREFVRRWRKEAGEHRDRDTPTKEAATRRLRDTEAQKVRRMEIHENGEQKQKERMKGGGGKVKKNVQTAQGWRRI